MRAMLVIILVALAPVSVHAQAHADSVHHRNDCRLARQVIETGQPSRHTDWALRQIGGCGSEVYGASIAAGVRRLRAETDTAVLGRLWNPMHFLQDGSLYDAALEIAGDRAASVPSRVFALLALIHASRLGTSATYPGVTGGFDEHGFVRGGCGNITVYDDVRITGTPLPADWRAQVQALGERLRSDLSEPLDVRTAASCLPG